MKFGTRSALTPAGWESMVALLDPLRLYDLSPESFVSRELMAYAAGLALFRQRLEQCRDDLFLATYTGWRQAGLAGAVSATVGIVLPAFLLFWGLSFCFEELLDLPVARTDEASRREMAAVKLSIGEGDFTPEGIRRSLLAAGLEAELEEDFSQRLIRVTDARIIGGYQTLDEVKAQVRRMLPAHLEVEFDIGVLTWEMFEAIGLDFAAWDSRDFTWEWFDLNGEKLGGE